MRHTRVPVILLACAILAAPCCLARIRCQVADTPDLPVPLSNDVYLREWVTVGTFGVPEAEQEDPNMAGWKHEWIDASAVRDLSAPVPSKSHPRAWQPLPTSADRFEVDLEPVLSPNTNVVTYVATYVYAKEDATRTLLLGSDDGVVVWWNGDKVHENYVKRACESDADKVPVQVKEGRNLLLLKVAQGTGGWSYACRFDANKGLSTGVAADPERAQGLPEPGRPSTKPARFAAAPYVMNTSTDAATVMWQTDVPSTGTLRVFHDKGAVTVEAKSPRLLHEVRITGLRPDTTYPYLVEVRNPGSDLPAAPPAGGRFRTFPAASRPVKVVVYGDTRTHPDRHRLVIDRMMEERDLDCVIHSGDIVGNGLNLEEWVPQFFRPAEPLIANVPMFFAIGNHENNSPYYFNYYDHPGNERWYSFDVGSVRFISLDSNVDYAPGSEQYNFLVGELARPRPKTPWLVVVSHHPTYTSSGHGRLADDGRPHETGVRTAQDIFPELAAKYGIDLVMSGHDHVYERSYRDGVHYIVSGGGGAPTYSKTDTAELQNPYSLVYHSTLHHCLLTADEEQLHVVVIEAESGKVLDELRLSVQARSAGR